MLLWSGLVLGLVCLNQVHSNPVPYSSASDGERRLTQRGVAWDNALQEPVVLLDFSPRITFPTQGTVFKAGGPGFITWNATLPSGLEQQNVSQTATIFLGYTDINSVGLHLDISHPLGVDIALYTPPFNITFTFPANLPTRSTYLMTLGSTSNQSPLFEIEGDSLPVPASSDMSASTGVATVTFSRPGSQTITTTSLTSSSLATNEPLPSIPSTFASSSGSTDSTASSPQLSTTSSPTVAQTTTIATKNTAVTPISTTTTTSEPSSLSTTTTTTTTTVSSVVTAAATISSGPASNGSSSHLTAASFPFFVAILTSLCGMILVIA